METLLFIITIVWFLYLSWWIWINQQYRNMKRSLKVGDPVSFFEEEKRIYTSVAEISDEGIYVWSTNHDFYFNYFGLSAFKVKVEFDDLYPIFWYNYKKQ